jgi:hypothetical protein
MLGIRCQVSGFRVQSSGFRKKRGGKIGPIEGARFGDQVLGGLGLIFLAFSLLSPIDVQGGKLGLHLKVASFSVIRDPGAMAVAGIAFARNGRISPIV